MRPLSIDLCAAAYTHLMKEMLLLCDEGDRNRLVEALSSAATEAKTQMNIDGLVKASMDIINAAQFAVSIRSPLALTTKELNNLWALEDPRPKEEAK